MQWYYWNSYYVYRRSNFDSNLFSCNTLATCTEGSVRLLAGMDYDYYYGGLDADYANLYIKDTLSQGRVQICIGGQYTKVCDDFWDNQDASVVCRQLGFSSSGELRTIHFLFKMKSMYYKIVVFCDIL